MGNAINEFAFEARGRIKQERINNFINNFAEYLGKFKKNEIHIDQIKEEDFGDFFEELIIKVSKTHSEIKKDAFRNLLINQLIHPKEIDYAEMLLDITNSLQEKQIPILKSLTEAFSSSYLEYKGELIVMKKQLANIKKQLKAEYWKLDSREDAMFEEEIKKLNEAERNLEKDIEKLESQVANKEKPWKGETYNIPNHEFYFLIQDLCNKGLLTDNGMTYGAKPFELVEISQLGIDLIESLT